MEIATYVNGLLKTFTEFSREECVWTLVKWFISLEQGTSVWKTSPNDQLLKNTVNIHVKHTCNSLQSPLVYNSHALILSRFLSDHRGTNPSRCRYLRRRSGDGIGRCFKRSSLASLASFTRFSVFLTSVRLLALSDSCVHFTAVTKIVGRGFLNSVVLLGDYQFSQV